MKKEFSVISLSDIIPYENNPRINDDAVADVIESIKQCENLAPIEIDENNVILSGHTRLKALQELGFDKTEVIKYTGLSEEQKRKYRILANKTGEKARWDFDKLEEELNDLDFENYDFGFNINQVDIEYLDSFFSPIKTQSQQQSEESSQVNNNYDDPQSEKQTDYSFEPVKKQIQCPHCGEWFIP